MGCVKCRVDDAPHRIRHVSYCDACLVAVTEQKYRASIVRSTSHLVRHADPIKCLIALSGGSSSRALLHLSDVYRTQIDRHDIRYKFTESIVLVVRNEYNKSHDFDLDALMKQYPRWTFIERSLSDLFPSDFDQPGMETWMDAVTTPTSKSDLHQHFVMHLILQTARDHHCHIALLGDSATQTAIHALSSVSKGRGYSLARDTAETVILDNTLIVRPLLSHLKKETELYCSLNGLLYADVKSYKEASIDALTTTFIESLDAEFPSTVSTITRTVAKLHHPSSETELSCVFCHALVQENCHTWRDMVTVNTPPFQSTDEVDPSLETKTFEEEKITDSLMGHLCYGCLNIHNDLIWDRVKNHLPEYVKEGITKNQERMMTWKMKQVELDVKGQ